MFMSMQNLTFKDTILVILGTLGMPGHTHQNGSIILLKTVMLVAQKINFISHFIIEMLQRCFTACKVINLIPPFVFEIFQRYYRLGILGTLGMSTNDQ